MRQEHGFIDESARDKLYVVAAALITVADVDAARRLAASFCKPGQRRWHFTNESTARRRTILKAIVDSGLVRAWIGYGEGDDADVRARCLLQLVDDLVPKPLCRLVIGSRATRDHHDRQALHGSGLDFYHLPPHGDPLLWIADALAWSYSRGGEWRDRVRGIATHDRDVGP